MSIKAGHVSEDSQVSGSHDQSGGVPSRHTGNVGVDEVWVKSSMTDILSLEYLW